MSNEHPSPLKLRQKSTPSGWFKRLLKRLTHNWGWKLGCLVLAVCLWGGLITQDNDLVRPKTFSDVTISQLNLDPKVPMFFRIAVPETARHVGGLTIFGRDFGNYNQDIEFRIVYSQ